MSWSLIGAMTGLAILAIAFPIVMNPKTLGKRINLVGFILAVFAVPTTLGTIADSEIARHDDAEQQRQAALQAQRLLHEQRQQAEATRTALTVAVAQILDAVRQPAGPRRTRALRSALAAYDRAVSELGPGPGAASNLAALVPTASEVPDTQARARSDVRASGQGAQTEAASEVSTTAATVPAVTSASSPPPPVVVTPVFIPPPPPIMMMPPPVVMTPH